MKAIFDYLTPEEYARVQELRAIAIENKANAPKAPRTPKEMTPEQAKAKLEKKIADAQAKLDALLAAEG